MATAPRRASTPGTPKVEAYVAPKYRHLLDDQDVARWHRNVSKGSLETGREYIRVLGRVMERMGHTPASFIALGQQGAEDALTDYVDSALVGDQDHKPLAGSSVEYHKAVVQSWMAWRNIPCRRDIKINRERNYHPRNSETRIPDRADLKRVLVQADPRTRFVITAMAYSALRPRVLADKQQQDGLRFRDLPEARLAGGKLVFDAIPTLVKVRANLSKNKKAYCTFFTQETCGYLAADVERRTAAGEKLTPDSFCLQPIKNSNDGVLTREQLNKIARLPMRKASVDANPYVWKSYCSDRMALGESDGFQRDYRVFMMGHNGGMTSDYAMRKQELSAETRERMRTTFEACATKHLEAFPIVNVQDDRLANVKMMLSALGMPPDQVRAMDLRDVNDSQLMELVHNRLVPPSEHAQDAVPDHPAGTPMQRLVDEEEAPAWLEKGWTVKTVTPKGRFLLQRES